MSKLSLFSVSLVALIAGAVQAEAASFNCRYAKSPVEVAICQDDDLQVLDERMAKYYFTLSPLLPYSARAQLKRSQSWFISRRNTCGFNTDCLNAAYEARIDRICSIAEDNNLSCDDFGD